MTTNEIIALIFSDAAAACDAIIDAADDLTLDDAASILHAARILDTASAADAAMIRDTLRDNTEYTLF